MPVDDPSTNIHDLDAMDRINTASDIRPNPGQPDFSNPVPQPFDGNNNNGFGLTNANTQVSSLNGDKPKVQIKPYKFTFD